MLKIKNKKIIVSSIVPLLAGAIAIGDTVNKEQILKVASARFSTILKAKNSNFQGCEVWLLESNKDKIEGRRIEKSEKYLLTPENINRIDGLEELLKWESFIDNCQAEVPRIGIFEIKWDSENKKWIEVNENLTVIEKDQ